MYARRVGSEASGRIAWGARGTISVRLVVGALPLVVVAALSTSCGGPSGAMLGASLDGELNACGGRAVLTFGNGFAAPGDSCGPCGDGTLVCTTSDQLACTDARPENACLDGRAQATQDSGLDVTVVDAASADALGASESDGPMDGALTPSDGEPQEAAGATYDAGPGWQLADAAAAASTPSDGGLPSLQCLDLTTEDMTFDPISTLLYATVPSTSPEFGNSVVRIDPATASVTGSVSVGSDPNAVSITDDATALYIGLDGINAVRRVDVASGAIEPPVYFGPDPSYGPLTAFDIRAVPGSDSQYVVALNPAEAGLALYDGSSLVTQTGISQGISSIAFASSTELYGLAPGLTGGSLFQWSVSSTGLQSSDYRYSDILFGPVTQIVGQGGWIFGNDGNVLNGITGDAVGQYAAAGAIWADNTSTNVWALQNSIPPVLFDFDRNSFAMKSSIVLPIAAFPGPVGSPSPPGSLFGWSSMGFAFRTASTVCFLTLPPALADLEDASTNDQTAGDGGSSGPESGPLGADATCGDAANSDGGACGVFCTAPYVPYAGACTAPAARPIGPLMGNAVSTRTPTLTWSLPNGFSAARVDVCADRPCSNVLWSADVTGTSVTVGVTLPVGMNYWRLTTLDGSVPGALVSPTWQFAVLGTHSAPVMRSWPNFADIEGDGYADLVYYSGTGPGSMVQELRGSPSGIATPVRSFWTPTGPCGGGLLAGSDVNGDGFSDVVVTSCALSLQGTEPLGPQQTSVLLGTPSGFAAIPTLTAGVIGGLLAGGPIGTIVGDVDADGYPDLVVLYPADGAGNPAGFAIFSGFEIGFGGSPFFVASLPSGATANAILTPPQAAGDINGDGCADFVISDSGFGGVGQVWVYLGCGMETSPAYTLTAPPGDAHFGDNGAYVNGPSWGGTVTSDVNGDGWPELFVSGQSGAALYMYPGSANGYVAAPITLTTQSSTNGVGTIYEFSGGCDVDGDGYGDLIVGESVYGGSGGRIDIYRGSPSGLSTIPSQTLYSSAIPGDADAGGAAADNGVRWISLLGDVNGDGLSDFVAAASLPSPSASGQAVGLAGVYLGSAAISPAPSFVVAGSVLNSFW